MNARTAEYFVIDAGADEVCKVNGVIFRHKGKLLGLKFELYTDGFAWWTYDIETGLDVAVTGFLPLHQKETLDDMIRAFETDVLSDYSDDEIERFIKTIKTAYDEHPEIKKQVFGN